MLNKLSPAWSASLIPRAWAKLEFVRVLLELLGPVLTSDLFHFFLVPRLSTQTGTLARRRGNTGTRWAPRSRTGSPSISRWGRRMKRTSWGANFEPFFNPSSCSKNTLWSCFLRHFQQWDTFWGKPGYGAPREGKYTQKENLMKILHYPQTNKVILLLWHSFRIKYQFQSYFRPQITWSSSPWNGCLWNRGTRNRVQYLSMSQLFFIWFPNVSVDYMTPRIALQET